MLTNNPVLIHWCTETVFKEKYGVWDPTGVDYNSPYLIVNSVVKLSTPTSKGKGWSGEDLSYWYICICLLISITTNRKRESTEKGKGWGES
jgi:hypothetical protein